MTTVLHGASEGAARALSAEKNRTGIGPHLPHLGVPKVQ
jgi:hypothetical protein